MHDHRDGQPYYHAWVHLMTTGQRFLASLPPQTGTDKQGLGKIFPDIAYQCTLPEMAARGYLSN